MQRSARSSVGLLSKGILSSNSRLNSQKCVTSFPQTPANILQRKYYSTEPSPVLVEVNDQVQWIRLNRPKAYNAMDHASYRAVIAALDAATENEHVKMTVVTGTGPYFSSGVDLSEY